MNRDIGTDSGESPARAEVRPKKKKQRVITSARRDQNREAQRLYRQRQKEVKEKIKKEEAAAASTCASRGPRKLAAHHPLMKVHRDASRTTLRVNEKDSRSSPDSSQRTRPTTASSASPSLTFNDDTTASSIEPSSLVRRADRLASSLQLLQIGLYSAVYQNAVCLGFDLDRFSQCGPDYISPFYRPDADLRSTPSSLMPDAGLMSHLPPYLRPTLTQMLVPHHVCLDVIPIPILRDRAILLSVTKPDACDLFDLKVDIFHKGGLMVWGSAGQRGDSGINESWSSESLEGRDYVPWNGKCWEAAPWFLNKWAMAVDGDEGELGKQSRWWKTVREAREAANGVATVDG